jgi:hypothetical protein
MHQPANGGIGERPLHAASVPFPGGTLPPRLSGVNGNIEIF